MQKREQSPMIQEGGVGNIKFENVSFKYEDRQEFVFRNISFEL
jgi:ABC-type multidrug transport system fused ATPase/permease subunit